MRLRLRLRLKAKACESGKKGETESGDGMRAMGMGEDKLAPLPRALWAKLKVEA